MAKTLRIIWTVLIGVFAVALAIVLYRWTEGKDNLRSLLSPLAFILIGTAALIRPRNAMLANVLTAFAIVSGVAMIILMIIY